MKKLPIFGFCMYDFANSAYTTVIITAVYSAFFVSYIAEGSSKGVYYWGIALAISNIAAMLLSPMLGAWIDAGYAKKKMLFVATSMCVVFTILLYFPDQGQIYLAVALIILSNLGYSLSETIVASFLPDVCPKEHMGKISGYAWAFGYIGGIVSLLLALGWMKMNGESISSIKFCAISTALFYGLCAIPSFVFMKEKRQQIKKASIAESYLRIRDTFRDVSRYKNLFQFLIAFFLFNSGIMTIISYSAIYAEQILAFPKSELILLIIVVNISSSIGAFIFGVIEDKIGPVLTIETTLYIWILVVIGAYFAVSKGMFYAIALFAGLVIGATQSSSRALVGILAPEEKSAEFFGFWGMTTRLSSVLGQYSFGLLVMLLDSQRIALLTNVLFFGSGLLIIRKIRKKIEKTTGHA